MEGSSSLTLPSGESIRITVGHPDWLSTIVLYGTAEGWEQLKRKAFADDEHRQRAAGLGDTVRTIHARRLGDLSTAASALGN